MRWVTCFMGITWYKALGCLRRKLCVHDAIDTGSSHIHRETQNIGTKFKSAEMAKKKYEFENAIFMIIVVKSLVTSKSS